MNTTSSQGAEVKPYLPPIPLTGEIKKRFCRLMNKIIGYDISEAPIYLQNKLTDPALHPNDYLRFEEPSKFKFEYILTTCKGIFPLKNMVPSEQMDDDLSNINEEFLHEAEELGDEGIIELECPELPAEAILHDEMISSENKEEINPDEMKIHEVMSYFKANHCERRKNGICKKQHYLIGIGDVIIDEKTYSGVHIYLYPDKHFDQVDVPEENIMDDQYLHYCTQTQKSPFIYQRNYLKKFNTLLTEIEEN